MEALLQEVQKLMLEIVLKNQSEPHKSSWNLEEVTNLMTQSYLHGQNTVLQMCAEESMKRDIAETKPLDPFAAEILLARCMGTLEALYATLRLPEDIDRKVLRLLTDISKATGMIGKSA